MNFNVLDFTVVSEITGDYSFRRVTKSGLESTESQF